MRRLACTFVLSGAALLFGAGSAGALGLELDCVSGNAAGDCAIGEDQLVVELGAGPGANQVSFTFRNDGPEDAVITAVYFDDDAASLGIASILDGSGVDFEEGASPPVLPSGNGASPSFEVTAGLGAGAEPPRPSNGVGPGEELTIVLDLPVGKTLADTEAALGDGSLRVGMHVQAFGSGGSESFVSVPVPEPGVSLLLAAPLLGLARWSRRR